MNVTSIAGHTAYVGGGGYNAAKFAAHALTEVLRLELNGEPLRVIEVAPGMVKTDEFALVRFGGDRARADAVYDDVPEPLVAEDIAGVIVDAVLKPRHVDLDLIVVKPVAQAAPHRVAKGDLVVRARRCDDLRGASEGDPATHRRTRYVDVTGRTLALLGVAFVVAYTVYVLLPERPQWVTSGIFFILVSTWVVFVIDVIIRIALTPAVDAGTTRGITRSTCSRPSCRCSVRCASSACCRICRS